MHRGGVIRGLWLILITFHRRTWPHNAERYQAKTQHKTRAQRHSLSPMVPSNLAKEARLQGPRPLPRLTPVTSRRLHLESTLTGLKPFRTADNRPRLRCFTLARRRKLLPPLPACHTLQLRLPSSLSHSFSHCPRNTSSTDPQVEDLSPRDLQLTYQWPSDPTRHNSVTTGVSIMPLCLVKCHTVHTGTATPTPTGTDPPPTPLTHGRWVHHRK